MIVEGKYLISSSEKGLKYGRLCKMSSYNKPLLRLYDFIFFGKDMGYRVLLLLNSENVILCDF